MDEWEYDNEPDYQALRDEEQIAALYDEYVERQYDEWCEDQKPRHVRAQYLSALRANPQMLAHFDHDDLECDAW